VQYFDTCPYFYNETQTTHTHTQHVCVIQQFSTLSYFGSRFFDRHEVCCSRGALRHVVCRSSMAASKKVMKSMKGMKGQNAHKCSVCKKTGHRKETCTATAGTSKAGLVAQIKTLLKELKQIHLKKLARKSCMKVSTGHNQISYNVYVSLCVANYFFA
jgi:hypothetical protein